MLAGTCLCKAVRYEVDGALGEIHHCHCSRCRKAHGAAFSTFGRLARTQLRIVAGNDAIRAYRSSPQIERTFCSVCGSNLTFAFDGLPDEIWVAVGTLDDDPGARPTAHIFAASQAPWHPISDELPQFAEYPPDA